MNFITALLVTIQAAVVGALIFRLRKESMGKLGFLLMASTFLYHGVTEIVQAIFPGYNVFRPLAEEGSLQVWIVLVTGAMCLFTMVYLYKLRSYKQPGQLSALLDNLAGAYLLKWPVLATLGLVGFGLIIPEGEKLQSGVSYYIAGLADQFAALIFALALGTLCITIRRRRHVTLFVIFAAVVAFYGSRLQVVLVLVIALSMMTRYGVRVSGREVVSAAAILASMFAAISVGRGDYGVLRHEAGLTRLQSFGSGSESFTDRIMEDSIYRFDGNSFGAMIVEKQLNGYGTTGLDQLLVTLEYNIPSFIYKGKLEQDIYFRSEKAYQDHFYGFDEEKDYISDFWSLLTGYVGMAGLLVVAPCLGWIFASIDNWLARSVTVSAYLCGACLSVAPITLEYGLAGIPYMLRGLLVIVTAAHLIRIRKRAKVTRPAVKAVREPGFANLPMIS